MTQTESAVRKQIEADQLRSQGRIHNRIAADRLDREAAELLAPVTAEASMTELIPAADSKAVGLRDTLQNPNCIGVDASEARMELLAECGALELGLDCAESVGVSNGVERMLTHQMAVMHALGMKLVARAGNERLPPVEAARLANSARGAFECFQSAVATMQSLRSGGKQDDGKQDINVNMVGDNSQAFIAAGRPR